MPATNTRDPPDPVLALPTDTVTFPPLPWVAGPEPIKTEPLFPEDEDPVLATSVPLTPLLPAFAVSKDNAPLLLKVPEPVVIIIEPPDPELVAVDWPAVT